MLLQDRVYNVVSKIPYGKVTTYGHIGRKIRTKAYRAIGQALHRNPLWPKIPCHRVVMKDGSLAPNYAMGGEKTHRERLESEGVEFKNNRVNLQKHLVAKL